MELPTVSSDAAPKSRYADGRAIADGLGEAAARSLRLRTRAATVLLRGTSWSLESVVRAINRARSKAFTGADAGWTSIDPVGSTRTSQRARHRRRCELQQVPDRLNARELARFLRQVARRLAVRDQGGKNRRWELPGKANRDPGPRRFGLRTQSSLRKRQDAFAGAHWPTCCSGAGGACRRYPSFLISAMRFYAAGGSTRNKPERPRVNPCLGGGANVG